MFQSLASYFYGTTSDTSEITTTSSDNQQDDPTVDVLTKPAAAANIVAKPLINNDNAAGAEDIDSDWLIVDKDGKLIGFINLSSIFLKKKSYADTSPVQTDSEEEIPFVEIKNAPVLQHQHQQQLQPAHHHHRRGRHSRNNSAGAGTRDGLLSLSPTSILPSSMEESWFVTPPPCFTSTGPIVMEMSPFENLLIEHPRYAGFHLNKN